MSIKSYRSYTNASKAFIKVQFMFRVFSQPANSNVSYKVGNWHASFPLRKETAAVTTSGWPDYRLQDMQGPFGY